MGLLIKSAATTCEFMPSHLPMMYGLIVGFVFQIPLADSFYDGIIELFISKANNSYNEKPYAATVRPHVYIIHTNQVGALIHDEPKTLSTWMTASGFNAKPHKTGTKQNCDFCCSKQ